MQVHKRIFKEAEDDSEEKKSEKAIDTLIKTKWSGSNEEQGRAIQLMRGLAFSDSDVANKFLKKLDDFTSTLDPSDFKE